MPQRVNGERRSAPSSTARRQIVRSRWSRQRAVRQTLEAVGDVAMPRSSPASQQQLRVALAQRRERAACSATRIRFWAIGERERRGRRRSRGSASAAAASRRSGSLSSWAVISRSCEVPERRAEAVVGELECAPSPSVAMRSIGGAVVPSSSVPPASPRAAHQSSSSRWSRPAAERDQPAVVQPPAAQVGLVGAAAVGGQPARGARAARARRARRRGGRGRRAARRAASRRRGRAAVSPGATASRCAQQQRLARLAHEPVRQKWLDQSQSVNLFLAENDARRASFMYREAWERGLKTTYYLRTLNKSGIDSSHRERKKSEPDPVLTAPACALDAALTGNTCEACQ